MAQAVQQQADAGRTEIAQRQQAISEQESVLLASVPADLASGGRKPPGAIVVPHRGANAPRSPRRSKGSAANVLTIAPAQKIDTDIAAPMFIEERVIAELRLTTTLSERHRQAQQSFSDLSNELTHKRKDETFLRAEIARLDKDLAATTAQIVQDKQSLATVEEEIRATAGTNDPVAESTKVQLEIEQIEQQLAETGRLEGDANRLRVLAESALDNCAARRRPRPTKPGSSKNKVSKRSARQNSPTPSAPATPFARRRICNSSRPRSTSTPSPCAACKRASTNWSNRCRARPSRARNAAKRSKRLTIVPSGATRPRTRASCSPGSSRPCRNGSKNPRNCAELIEHERQQFIFDQLAKDLRSDYFQAFLLEETLTGLVRDASAQLMRLTGERYGLFFEEERIFVIDHDNAAERRGIETLSGGETFLASLALALALSEQVQKIAGAVHLDCLFIDEGFGALDPETLRTVSDTIRALQVGGRMVGVITHVPEIKDEFDQRLLVEKKEGVSHVQVEVA